VAYKGPPLRAVRTLASRVLASSLALWGRAIALISG
jgi:hypothetical protein